MRDASGDVVNHDDVVTCDVITSDVITSDDITSIDITSDMVDDDVQSNILAGQGPLVNDGINYGGLMLEEQIVETSEDAFFQVRPCVSCLDWSLSSEWCLILIVFYPYQQLFSPGGGE